MKENWINKLIELLNEYDDWMVSWYEEYFPTEWLFVTNAGQWFREEFILGRRFWFIKRLVENNRINIERLHKIVDYRLEIKENYVNTHDYNSDCLLMLLSISDTPIEDLISYLR